jgi:hypothetical protein
VRSKKKIKVSVGNSLKFQLSDVSLKVRLVILRTLKS